MRTLYVSAAIFVSMVDVSYAASFDCAKATRDIEKMICTNSQLSQLDERLAKSYRYALTAIQDKKSLKTSQREWLKFEVAPCSTSTCVEGAYRSRIELLENVASPAEPMSKWSGNYRRYIDGKPDSNTAGIFIIGLRDGRIYALGNAIWDSGDGGRNVHSGMLNAFGKQNANTMVFGEDGCNAVMSLHGQKLTVTNEFGCGGLGVTFNGLYIKQTDN